MISNILLITLLSHRGSCTPYVRSSRWHRKRRCWTRRNRWILSILVLRCCYCYCCIFVSHRPCNGHGLRKSQCDWRDYDGQVFFVGNGRLILPVWNGAVVRADINDESLQVKKHGARQSCDLCCLHCSFTKTLFALDLSFFRSKELSQTIFHTGTVGPNLQW